MNNLKQKLKSAAIVTAAGCGVFVVLGVYKGNEKFYKEVVMPLMHRIDPERAHELAVFFAKHRLFPKSSFKDPPVLKCNFFDKQLSNPVGIAAGFDKHGEAISGLKDIGFGFIEIGSVTPQPQSGNEKPRLFRLAEDKAVINRYGFNSVGHDKVVERLDCIRNEQHLNYALGVNLGKNKSSTHPIADYVEGVKKFAPYSDYLVINISSPNTPGLRSLQMKVALEPLLKAVVEARNDLPLVKKPYLLLKLAPDLSYRECEEIAEVLNKKSCRIDGLIVCNSTLDRPEYLKSNHKNEAGGLSGLPLAEASTKMISNMHKLTNGMMIIGVGGVFNGKDAYEKIKAGASVVQLYTGMVYEGPPIVTKIKSELADLLVADGYTNVTEAVGKDLK